MSVLANKKKKKNNSPKQSAQAASAEAAGQNTEKKIDEENIPIQSFSDMLAFAHEAEAELEEKEITAESEKSDNSVNKEIVINVSAPKDNTSEEEKKQAPVKAESNKTTEKISEPAPKPEPAKTQEESQKSEPVKQESKPKEEPKPDPKPAPKQEAPKQSAPAAQKTAAEDALDRDLELAHRKKMREQAYEQKKKEEEEKKEAERLEKANLAKQRAVARAEAAAAAAEKKENEEKAAQAPKASSSQSSVKAPRRRKPQPVSRGIDSLAAGRGAAIAAALLIVLYGGSFIYTKSLNDGYLKELDSKLTGQSRSVNEESLEYEISSLSPLTYDEKTEKGLSVGLADSDKDGLSDYYEINVSGTDPKIFDSDGDGINDGDEVNSGLDPLSSSTDGTVSDSDYTEDVNFGGAGASISVKSCPKTAYISFLPSDNKTIQGTPGLIVDAFDFYCDSENGGCTITFTYTDEQLAAWKTPVNALSVFRFNNDTLSFDKIESTINSDSRTVSAEITENGIYALGDEGIIMKESNTQIFFLIDNSGSMYPEEMCANSEENDVEFKRLDFTMNLIDMLKDEASFGAAQFSGSFKEISPITDNADDVRAKVDAIRTTTQNFSGTDIAGSLISAVSEFSDADLYDKNYIVLLTDGMPSNPNAALDEKAITAANQKNITVFTIGLGKYIDAEYLYNIADRTNGQFFQASNADALENIYEKIQNFMSYNQVIIEEDTGKKGFILADCGLNVEKDGLAYNNFRTDFAPNGADFGIAGIIHAYYRGELPLAASGYKTSDGTEIPGYQVGQIAQFTDGKADLSELQIGILDTYNSYLILEDKWDYGSIKGGLLRYTDKTRDYVTNHSMSVSTVDYTGTLESDSGFIAFLKKITFHSLPVFNEYECALINSKSCTDDDLQVMNMFNYYCNLPKSDKCTVYDFGYDGETAMAVLTDELTTGNPAVISFGGSAMNAVRIIREASNPNKFVLEAYDSNSPGRITKISLTRTAVFDGTTKTYQYSASRGTQEQPLRLFVY